MMMLIPNVIFKRKDGREIILDLHSRLFNLGKVFLTGEINESTMNTYLASLAYLTSELQLKCVTTYINSGGGMVYQGLGIIDAILSLPKSIIIETKAVGFVASAATLPLIAGTPGHRHMSTFTRAMIHQPSGGTGRGTAASLQVYVDEIQYLYNVLLNIYRRCSSNDTSEEVFRKLMEQDNYRTMEQMRDLGLVDGFTPIYDSRFIDVYQKGSISTSTPSKESSEKSKAVSKEKKTKK